jgi:hypothetical protein
MWCRVDLLRTNVVEERVTSIFRVGRMNELGTAVTISVLVTDNVIPSSQILFTLNMVANK